MTSEKNDSVCADPAFEALPGEGLLLGAAHVMPVLLYYEDTDLSGLVYHAGYVRFFERGRTNFLRKVGCYHSDLAALEDPRFFVVAKMDIAFKKPARVDDRLVVETRFPVVTGATLTGQQVIYKGSRKGDILVTASLKAACIDSAGKPRRLPEGLAATLSELNQREPIDRSAG